MMAVAGINIEALSLIDNIEQGVLRFVLSDPAPGKVLLIQAGYYVIEADVLAIEVADSLGRLAQMSRALAEAKINIEYAYGSVDRTGEKTRVVMKVSNITQACQILSTLHEEPSP